MRRGRSSVPAQRATHGCSYEIELVTVPTLEEEKREPFPGSDLDISSPAPQGSWMPLEIEFSAKKCHVLLGWGPTAAVKWWLSRQEGKGCRKEASPERSQPGPWRVDLFMGTPRKVKWPLPPQKQLQNSAWGHGEPEVTPAAVVTSPDRAPALAPAWLPCAYPRFPGQ